VYSAGTLNTVPARQVDPVTFHEAVLGPDQLEWWAAIQKEFDNQSRFARSVGFGLEDPFAANHMISGWDVLSPNPGITR
jgi:hypothetical protein